MKHLANPFEWPICVSPDVLAAYSIIFFILAFNSVPDCFKGQKLETIMCPLHQCHHLQASDVAFKSDQFNVYYLGSTYIVTYKHLLL